MLLQRSGLNLVGIEVFSPTGFTYGATTTENLVRCQFHGPKSCIVLCGNLSCVNLASSSVAAAYALLCQHYKAQAACRPLRCHGRTCSGSRSTR